MARRLGMESGDRWRDREDGESRKRASRKREPKWREKSRAVLGGVNSSERRSDRGEDADKRGGGIISHSLAA